MKEIQEEKIQIYEFPECEDEEENRLNKKLKNRVPFAVVGSNTVMESGGKKVRGRQYPWGVAEVENIDHCDFTVLRDMLIRTHMQDLKDVTNNVHYENYRSRKLSSVTTTSADGTVKTPNKSPPLAQMEDEETDHMAKMKKMELEMEEALRQKVQEKKQKLMDSENHLSRRHEAMKKKLEQEYALLDDKQRQFEKEKLEFEAQQQRLQEERNKNDNVRTLEERRNGDVCADCGRIYVLSVQESFVESYVTLLYLQVQKQLPTPV
jgi:septin 7